MIGRTRTQQRYLLSHSHGRFGKTGREDGGSLIGIYDPIDAAARRTHRAAAAAVASAGNSATKSHMLFQTQSATQVSDEPGNSGCDADDRRCNPISTASRSHRRHRQATCLNPLMLARCYRYSRRGDARTVVRSASTWNADAWGEEDHTDRSNARCSITNPFRVPPHRDRRGRGASDTPPYSPH
jgi:hypothetical protein